MAIYFCNKEPIDLNAIAVMGVSVKEGENRIGFFGTGLKFALATILRSGCAITLIRNGETITFGIEGEQIRNENFDRVKMGEERLGFTTKLGRSWEMWQAYRELHCNCTDEDGVIATEMPDGEWGTVFVVSGEAIEKCHRERHKIFISSDPLFANSTGEIHHGGGHVGFYRGVKAHTMNGHALFSYNLNIRLELTEDRTVKYGFVYQAFVAELIATCDDEGIIETALMAPVGTFEHDLNYDSCGKPSSAFMAVAFRLRSNVHCNQSALKLWEKHSDTSVLYTEVEIDTFEQGILDKALRMTARLGVDIDRRDFMIVDGLGANCFGLAKNGRILIARRSFDMGHRFLASTLYEEWLHVNEGLQDQSRDLQNLLFEKLFAMVERIMTMES